MKVHEVLKEWGRADFSAVYICEHCEKFGAVPYGYKDANYFDNVIPAMNCPHCGKNRDGSLETERNGFTGGTPVAVEPKKEMVEVTTWNIVRRPRVHNDESENPDNQLAEV